MWHISLCHNAITSVTIPLDMPSILASGDLYTCHIARLIVGIIPYYSSTSYASRPRHQNNTYICPGYILTKRTNTLSHYLSHRNSTMHVSKVLFISTLAATSNAGPIAYRICQAGCAGVVMACYGAAGATWGATAAASAPATVIACNRTFGVCQAACWITATLPYF